MSETERKVLNVLSLTEDAISHYMISRSNGGNLRQRDIVQHERLPA